MKNNKGLTLVELLITIVILGLVMIVISTILFQAFAMFRDSTERVSNNRLLEIMIADLNNNIREARYFDFTSANTWDFFSAVDEDGNLIEGFRIIFDPNNDLLSIEKSGNNTRTLVNVKKFELVSESGQNEYKKDSEPLDSFIFTFNIEVDLGTSSNREIEKSVYSRNN